MKPRFRFLFLLPVTALILVGCGRKESAEAGHDHSEHAGEAEGEAGSVTYKDGSGLLLSPEVTKALGLVTTDVVERAIAPQLSLTAQVFTTAPRVLASARVPEPQATLLEKSKFTGARLERVDRSTVSASGLVDLVFDLGASGDRKVGDFAMLTLAVEPTSALAVPRSALLDGATGTFVYVVNGGAYLRTPVKVGARSAEFIEIADGLLDGDVVVVSPVEQLWLAELRLTKGGGHSH